MKWFQKAEATYQKFILSKIPKKLLRSQVFFFSLLLLALPITVFFANQLRTGSIQRLASDSVTPVTPPNPSPVSISSRVFITSTTYTGNLGGLSGADAKCQARADTAELGGTWKAWLSDNTTAANSRLIQSVGPYKLLNGKGIADNWADLVKGSILNPINTTEFNMQTNASHVWTGSASNGNIRRPDNYGTCANWTNSVMYAGVIGDPNKKDETWSEYSAWNCSFAFPLYCIEQVSPPSITPSISSCVKQFSQYCHDYPNSTQVTCDFRNHCDQVRPYYACTGQAGIADNVYNFCLKVSVPVPTPTPEAIPSCVQQFSPYCHKEPNSTQVTCDFRNHCDQVRPYYTCTGNAGADFAYNFCLKVSTP